MHGVNLTDPLLTHSAKNGVFQAVFGSPMKKAQARKLRPFKKFRLKAGDGIRTHDVQLGKTRRARAPNGCKSLDFKAI